MIKLLVPNMFLRIYEAICPLTSPGGTEMVERWRERWAEHSAPRASGDSDGEPGGSQDVVPAGPQRDLHPAVTGAGGVPFSPLNQHQPPRPQAGAVAVGTRTGAQGSPTPTPGLEGGPRPQEVCLEERTQRMFSELLQGQGSVRLRG